MQIRSTILSREVLSDVRSAYATISSEESYRVTVGSIAGSSQRNQASAFVSNVPNSQNFQRSNQNFSAGPSRPNNLNNNRQGGGSSLNNNRQGGGSSLVCENYGFNGHTIDRCFKIIGYPVDFGKKKSGQNFKKQSVSNNNSAGKSSSSGFTDEQMATLISLIKDNKVGKNVQANMAGANQHMTHTDKELDNVLDIFHLKIKVGHPNGTKAYISKIRNLRLSNGLTLYDVMVIPEYCVTLISVHKLVKENKVIVAFDENRCHPADPVLNVLKDSLNIDKKDNTDLWGLIKVTSSEGFRFLLTVVDDYTRAVWVYLIKSKDEFMSSGEIDRYKARLVAQGFRQKEGNDYEETFSPVVKMVTVRCLLNIVVSMSWPVFQLDVNNAFLYGDLEEVVFMKPPEGYFPSDNKSDKGVFLALLVYVDDIIITGNSVSEIEKFKVFLKKYVLDLLSEYGMLACKPAKTPLMSKLVISNEASENDPLLENITDYQKLMGKLIYLTNTRPDISYVVHCLSQFMHSPLSSHLKTAFKILRYLKSCPGLGIHIARTSVRNKILSKSSTEVEYRALASVTSEVIWILKILKDLQIGNLLPHSLRCDSNSTIKIDVNPVFHERTKHLEIDLL
ncbi:ribonuclease H-like domain-containing protein [Tanacetum coccineum]|uniref:Ribonuclease H-like domain-containing protein n=1 Tax=Tanacetum coccineum TaxID=301880 RepID=A0ABQ4YUJ0_9ASTR